MKHRHLRTTLWIMLAGIFFLPAIPGLAQYQGRTGMSSGYGGTNNRSRNSATSTAQQSPDGARQMGSAVIQYDPETASIIVITDEETNGHIKSVIDSMDRPTPQVLIKVLFLQVQHTDEKDMGVEFQLKNVDGKDVQDLSTVFGVANATQGGFYKILEGDLQATIHAIATNNKMEVLSRPSVLTRNNQEATVTVGQKIPIITNSRITEDGQTINTIEWTDIGIILDVRPRILPDRMVELDVSPEISNLTADTVPISNTVDARVIAERSANTSVVVKDGKTVVIGGMMENNITKHVAKVPLLGDIKYVGALFRRTIETKVKTELLIFLTPIVVENPDQLREVSASEKENGTSLASKAISKEEMKRFLNDPSTRLKEKPQAAKK